MISVALTNVKAQTTASFSANPTSGCAPLTVDFTNSSLQANSFFWDFGNGNTSVLPNPTTAYLSPGFYTVTLIATNTLTGQEDTLTEVNYINIIPTPNPGFSASPLSGCAYNNIITFNNTTTGGVTYTWDFGDGNASVLQNPTHSYANPGSYTVKLIATNGFGCNSIVIQTNYITISPAPNVSFTSDYTSTCDVNQVFNFTGSGTAVTSWFWNFGDGTTSTLQNPSHTYSSSGSYNVSLIATNSFGCTDTAYVPNYISIGNSLVPSYTINNNIGCGSLSAHFNCTVPNGTSWLWDFGDGSPASTLENPVHNYTASGSYTVTLTVTTTSGCDGTKTFTNAIIIDPLPVANFSASQVSPCNPYLWHFTNLSSNGVNYLWEFGDGTISTQSNPNHLFGSESIFDVTLHVYTAHGCEAIFTLPAAVDINDAKVIFTATPKIGCKPLTVTFTASNYPNVSSWFWKFGDGGTSTLQNPTHTYTADGNYNVSLKVTTTTGCADSTLKSNFIKVVPGQINYTVPDTIIGCLPFTASFTDPTIGSNMWHWDFGTGDTSNLQNPTYLFQDTGVFIITLQTSMPGGCSQFFNPFAIVHIFDFPPEPIEVISQTTCSPFQIELTDSTQGIVSWQWDFGDGTTANTQSAIHVYSQAGTYNISLTMLTIVGCRIVLDTTITFGHPNPLSFSNPTTCTDDIIQFTLGTPGAFTSHTWDFGDGSPLTSQQNPSHNYPVPGDYIVTLTTNDTAGCTDIYTDTLFVRTVVAGFTASGPTTGCFHLNVNFTNTSTGATDYLWDFGDSTTSTLQNPNHNYTSPGIYTVTLTASAGGCTRSVTQVNYVTVDVAVADFSYSAAGTCFPITVTYTDLSVNPATWLWTFGDGGSDTVQNPVHTFYSAPTAGVKLVMVNINGCHDIKTKNNINVTPVNISVSDTAGCKPFQVNFSDLTSGATSWHWDFGDGSTSNNQNPSHTYADTGSYGITLIVSLAAGCVDTVFFPDYITVTAPFVDFTSPTVAVCAPSLVSFNNLSLNTVSYLWDFGDGITSTAQNPSHIYNIPGDYTISLTAWDSAGCTATEVKTNYIHVPGTFAYFTLASQTNCLQTMVQFLDSSINATSWTWNFGDGYTSTLENPSHLYQDTGSYIVSLITSDSLGCTSFYSYPDSIVVHPNPVALAAVSDTVGCNPHFVSFTNSSTGATAYTWNFGNGDSLNTDTAVYTYTTAGIYHPNLVAVNQYGCTDTFYLHKVRVLQTPLAAFTVANSAVCSGDTFAFNNTSMALISPTYNWTIGPVNSTAQNPIVVFTIPGFYNAYLLVVNANGCRDSVQQSNYLQVYDTTPPPVSPIMSVSVKNNTSVEIKWLPNASTDLEEYRLFRYNTNTSVYDLIYSELHPNNSNANVTGIYTDTLLNTLTKVYTYKLQTIDRCGYRLSLDSSIAHSTINVTATTQAQDIHVNWTAYAGCAVSTYEIQRVEIQNGSSQLIAIVPSTQLTYLDSGLNCPFYYSYRIKATDLCGNSYISLSDTSVAMPQNIFTDQKVDVVRSTVVFNKSVLTEWGEPNIPLSRVLQYNILRSTDSVNYSLIASLPANVFSYEDEQVDVNHQNYYYKVDVISDCNLAGLESGMSSSILLQSDWVHEQPKVWWTEYKNWDSGVDYYTIEKKNEAGQWVLIKTVDGQTKETLIDE
ncbi:MAG TPA: PKD domain-containing protein [Bacteroidia bacterium]|nr:PKD domain-containing protein [Bacteroidia bacterium]